ncbi:MAG: SUMF1/EgtB/PvdO family nonheme iron enzyme [Bacteroidia bacterium]
MKKTTLLLIAGLLSLSLQAQQISNVTFVQEGQEVKVKYDFTGAGSKPYDIGLYYSQDNGAWKGPLKAVSGAVGSNQGGGYSREIRWRASEEVAALSSSNVRFKVSVRLPADIISIPEMVFVEGGMFEMGNEEGYGNEKPVHSVGLMDFWLGKSEITVGQFAAFVNATGYITDAEKTNLIESGNQVNKIKQTWCCDLKGNLRIEAEYNYPVVYISWNDANEYCKWLSKQTGEVWRLPTEAEWEYAAGGGRENRTKFAGTNNRKELENYAWISENSKYSTHPIGEKLPNVLGLCDMSGNVWEWCKDWYYAYPSEKQIDPRGPETGVKRVIRGGSSSWGNDGSKDVCRITYRKDKLPDTCEEFIGFRVVREAVNPNNSSSGEPQWYEFRQGDLGDRRPVKLVRPEILVSEKSSLQFEFVVEPNGSVSFVKLVGVTNASDRNEAGIHAIKKWRFDAIPTGQPQIRKVIRVTLLFLPPKPGEWCFFDQKKLGERIPITVVKPETSVQEIGFLQFEFVIEPNGSVSFVKLVGVTNKLGLKEAGISAIRHWKFNALSPNQPQQRQTASVTIRFE